MHSVYNALFPLRSAKNGSEFNSLNIVISKCWIAWITILRRLIRLQPNSKQLIKFHATSQATCFSCCHPNFYLLRHSFHFRKISYSPELTVISCKLRPTLKISPLLSYQTCSNFLASAGQYIMNQAKNGKTFQTCNGLNTQQKIRHRFNLNSPPISSQKIDRQ